MINDESTNSLGDSFEHATYCKVGDAKRPGLVGQPDGGNEQVCDDDLDNPAGAIGRTLDPATGLFTPTFTKGTIDDALAAGWYARIQFDELLNTDVETLTENVDDNGIPDDTYTGHIKTTAPVTLQCDTAGDGTFLDVPYDGYYQPAGNSVTWPLGPSLVVVPDDYASVATGSACRLTIKDGAVLDKQGISVPSEQLGTDGAYIWSIEALDLSAVSPDPEADATMPPAGSCDDDNAPENCIPDQPADAPITASFNVAEIDAASVPASEVVIELVDTCDGAATATHTATVVRDDVADPVHGDPATLDIADSQATGAPDNAWTVGQTYRVTFADGATAADSAGGTMDLYSADDLTWCFTASAPAAP